MSLFSWTLAALLLSLVLVESQRTSFPNRRDCEVVDLVFILDRSWSLRSPANFQKELDFVSQVVSVLDFENSRVSVITFSDDADLNIRFSDYYTLADFQRAVRALPWVGGNTYTHKAIELMMTEENQRSRDRAGITSIGVIVTDGGSTDPYRLEDVVRQVHDKRIEMYAIGVGDEVNQKELEMLASSYDHVYLLKNVNALSQIQDKLAARFCRGTPAPSTQAPPQDICRSEPADIFFLVDASSSLLNQENFAKELQFVVRIVDNIIVGARPDDSRVGVITFSTDATLEFGLSRHTSNRAVKDAILALNFTTGDTFTHKAIDIMYDQFNKFMRRSTRVKKIGFVITDGQSTDPNSLRASIDTVKGLGIEIYAVGAGDFDSQELEMMASDRSKVAQVDNLDKLNEITFKLNLKTCT